MTNLSNLTQEQIEELENLKKNPIDHSDIPQTLDFSKAAFKYHALGSKKQTVTMRLEADMSYDVLTKELRSIPDAYLDEITEFVAYIKYKAARDAGAADEKNIGVSAPRENQTQAKRTRVDKEAAAKTLDELCGMWKEHDNSMTVDEYVRNLRKGRKFDI